MAAQKKYPDELRERAVKMLFEVREREGKGRGELPGLRVSWVSRPGFLGGHGQARPVRRDPA